MREKSIQSWQTACFYVAPEVGRRATFLLTLPRYPAGQKTVIAEFQEALSG